MPQGSVLGPLLFLIYINDLCKCIKYSENYHFADDILAERINFDLKNLSQWLYLSDWQILKVPFDFRGINLYDKP